LFKGDGVSEVSGTLMIDNIRRNIISFNVRTDMFKEFTINNLLKTATYYLVFNTINTSPKVPSSLESSVTPRFDNNINLFTSSPALIQRVIRGGDYSRKRKSILKKNITKKHKVSN